MSAFDVMALDNPLAGDLDRIISRTECQWAEMRGQRLFITGGTGFFGRWLLESFAWANDHLKLDARAVVLSRRPGAFRQKAPHLAAHPAIQFHFGDVRDFVFPTGHFSHVIHGATDASVKLNADHPLLMFDTIVQGTRRTLEFAAQAGVRKFLFLSSGAVYGRQPPDLKFVTEDYCGAPDSTNPREAYSGGKRVAELLCSLFAKTRNLEAKIARCFAFVGPHMQMDAHFAVGNFIRNAMHGGPIQVAGDGTPMRSYLHSAELAAWLWTILFRGVSCRAYNVGSESCLSIAEIADAVAGCFTPRIPVEILQKPAAGLPSRYVPSIQRAREELGLAQEIDPCGAILKTIRWLQDGDTRPTLDSLGSETPALPGAASSV